MYIDVHEGSQTTDSSTFYPILSNVKRLYEVGRKLDVVMDMFTLRLRPRHLMTQIKLPFVQSSLILYLILYAHALGFQ